MRPVRPPHAPGDTADEDDVGGSGASFSSNGDAATTALLPPTIFVRFASEFGLGNRLQGVAFLTAVARASGRAISVFGQGCLWAPYWTSRFSTNARPEDPVFPAPAKICSSFNESADCSQRRWCAML